MIVRLLDNANTVPTTVHWLVTTQCGHGCPGCYYRKDQAHAWSLADAERFVRDAADSGVSWLAIGGGEPTEWPHLEQVCAQAVAAGLRVAVTTNGVRPLPIVAHRVQVSHDLMHGAHMLWSDRQAQVWRAINFYRQYVTEVGINTQACDTRVVDIDMLRAIDNLTIVLPKPFNPQAPWVTNLDACIARNSQFTRVCLDSCLAVYKRGEACGQGRISVSVAADGRVAPCSNTRHPSQWRATHGLLAAWDQIKCVSDDLPAGCIVADKAVTRV